MNKKKKKRKGNLTRFNIVDIYDDVPYVSIKFTTQITKKKKWKYPYPPHDCINRDT
jgi:hypothetical protein